MAAIRRDCLVRTITAADRGIRCIWSCDNEFSAKVIIPRGQEIISQVLGSVVGQIGNS